MGSLIWQLGSRSTRDNHKLKSRRVRKAVEGYNREKQDRKPYPRLSQGSEDRSVVLL